jgi:chromosome segregation ATPase
LVLLGAIDPAIAAIGTFIGTIVAAYVSIRLVRPRQKQIVAAAGDLDSQRWNRLMERYERVVEEQDRQLQACHKRIDELEEAERDCETRADELHDRVLTLERALRDAGIDPVRP